MRKLGLIAGGGELPTTLARHCRAAGRPLFVVRLTGFAPAELADFDGADLGMLNFGAGIDALRGAGCEAVCFAGKVDRPHFQSRGAEPGDGVPISVAQAASGGDGGLLTVVTREFERASFVIEGPDEVMRDLLLPQGSLGRHSPGAAQWADIHRALEAARVIGALDAGQGAVCCDGLILALEAQEGTDAMLRRVENLPPAIRGSTDEPRGALAKACKPTQDARIDLPTLGPSTIRQAARAGLAGIAGEAGRVLIVDRAAMVTLADRLGLFVEGVASARA